MLRHLFPNLLLLLIFLSGCNDSPTIKTAIAYADSILTTHPDSSLAILRRINPDEIRSAQLKAEYSLIHTIALDKNFIDLKTDSVIQQAIHYYSRKGKSHKKAQAFYYLGRIYCNNKDSDNGIRALTEAKLHALNTPDNYLCALIYNTLANLYYSQDSFREAIEMYQQSSEHFERAGNLGKKANALSYIGKSLHLLKKYDSSAVFYQQAKEIYIQLNDSKKVLLINSALAEKLVITQQYNAAIHLVEEGYNLYNQGKIPERDYTLWTRIYLGQSNPAKARQFALDALNHKYTTGRIKSGLYALLYQAYLKEHNYQKACKYLDLSSLQAIADSQKAKENLIQEIKERHTKEKLQTSYRTLEKEHRYQRIIYTLVFLMALFAGGIVLMRQRSKRKILQERYERELAEAHNYLETIEENFTQLNTQYNALKKSDSKSDDKMIRFLRSFENRLTQLKNIIDIAYTTESKPAHFYNKFKEYINTGSKAKDAFEDLQYVVNEKYFGIIDHLQTHYPSLTKSDLDLCSMLCFGFTSNSIRLIYGHSNMESIFQKRKKIREKINIPPNLQLETYIKKLKLELEKKRDLNGV